MIDIKKINMQDVISGGGLTTFGLFVSFYSSINYTVGTASHMGPGYFPLLLGLLLAFLGAIILLIGCRSAIQQNGSIVFALRPFFALSGAILVFSLLVLKAGLVPATLAMTFVAAFAERSFNLRRTLLLGGGLALLSWLVFTLGLKIQLSAFAF